MWRCPPLGSLKGVPPVGGLQDRSLASSRPHPQQPLPISSPCLCRAAAHQAPQEDPGTRTATPAMAQVPDAPPPPFFLLFLLLSSLIPAVALQKRGVGWETPLASLLALGSLQFAASGLGAPHRQSSGQLRSPCREPERKMPRKAPPLQPPPVLRAPFPTPTGDPPPLPRWLLWNSVGRGGCLDGGGAA